MLRSIPIAAASWLWAGAAAAASSDAAAPAQRALPHGAEAVGILGIGMFVSAVAAALTALLIYTLVQRRFR